MIRQETDPDVLEMISFKTLTGRYASSVRMKDIAAAKSETAITIDSDG